MTNEAIIKALRNALNRSRMPVAYSDDDPPSMRPPVSYDSIRLSESVQAIVDLLEADKHG